MMDTTSADLDLGGGFSWHRRSDGSEVIVATALEGTGAFGYCSPGGVDGRLDADVLAWLTPWDFARHRALRSVDQVHGAVIVDARSLAHGEHPSADGVWTSSSDDLLAVRSADCAAIWLVDPEHQLLCMAHAGWRGAAAGLARAAVDALVAAGGDAGAFVAAIGPHLGACCFEVGPEVAERFADIDGALGPADLLVAPRARSDSVSLNLAAVLFEQLHTAGVPQSKLHVATACTRCNERLLHSYRRNGKGGPLMASIGMLAR